jgi:hypothetical protein
MSLAFSECDPNLVAMYEAWMAKTGDACAAATMTLATVQARQLIPKEIDDALIGLDEAAQYLGYKPSGLRKVVRHGQIQYVQNGRGPIKFKRKWLDDFIAGKADSKGDIKRSPAQKRARSGPTISQSKSIFDSSLYRN